jgi:hypothetical protein
VVGGWDEVVGKLRITLESGFQRTGGIGLR